MDLFANPVTLGGLAAFVALGAWAMGRLQGAAEPPCPVRYPDGPRRRDRHNHLVPDAPVKHALAAPPQSGTRSQLMSSLELADSLGELHAEISAFRRQERVLASLEAELLPLHIASGDYAAAADPAGFAPLVSQMQKDGAINPQPALRS